MASKGKPEDARAVNNVRIWDMLYDTKGVPATNLLARYQPANQPAEAPNANVSI